MGFIIFRKRADDIGGGQYEEVASFQNFPPLNSRGCVDACFHLGRWSGWCVCVCVCVCVHGDWESKPCRRLPGPDHKLSSYPVHPTNTTTTTNKKTNSAEGGFYSFVDEDVEPGQYLYRVTDQDRCVFCIHMCVHESM